MELKDKTPDKILSKMRGFKREIVKLKNQVETQMDIEDLVVMPTPQVRIDVMRDYMIAAEEYLISIGGTYEPSKLELRAEVFDSNIDYIKQIAIEYGGYFNGAESRTLKHDGDIIIVERAFFNEAFDDGKKLYNDMTWNDLMEVTVLYSFGRVEVKICSL